MTDRFEITPFLKWAGGKRWFVQRHADLIPKNFNRYIEPFLGGGSVFFYLQPSCSLLGDANPDLIAAYRGIKENWKAVVKSLQYHSRQHSDEYFYLMRGSHPKDVIRRASRMIYLNRTCFNGIYRVNLRGEFNVPRGTKDSVLLSSDRFDLIAKLLESADIRSADFEILIDEAQTDDFIFADPPYTVRHNFNGFVKYNEKLFSWQDQERLAEALIRAKNRGVHILSTNANHSSIRDLYENYGFKLNTTSRFSSISALSKHRKQFDEMIISFTSGDGQS
ncbi:DNA methyltransferase [Methylomonas sp. LWB]|uniref:DNA adenine methylase n=1 Tax=Methylomonas sp. LWB TaxID=1905845 RepID=UPI0008D9C4FC|nr:Dam family site-specific DNA-(adenine-N6)-methyltransferase [Methylomonas sp. LWB]OHX34312.1 DNA methyltransferase [Methylomonas sp. LWB]